jgi:hypothetical protein
VEQTYYDDLAAQFERETGGPKFFSPPQKHLALVDLLKRVARESLEDGLKLAKACSVGDMKKDTLTGVALPETPDQAHVRKVELALIGRIESQFQRALAGQK